MLSVKRPPSWSDGEWLKGVVDTLPLSESIVVEGPDGAGKTTLVEVFLEKFPDYSRATKLMNEAGELQEDFHTRAHSPLRPFYIYDRHPVISEPVYGLLFRGEVRPTSPHLLLQRSPLVVFLIPSLERLLLQSNANPQLPGLGSQVSIERLREAYLMAYHIWPGPKVLVTEKEMTGVL